MIIDKISNGRVSIKYFRELYRSDLYKRVEAWYHSTKWGFYSARQKEIVQQSPSIYTIADYILGTETEEKNRTTVVCNNKKMRVKTIERLIPCIIDGKRYLWIWLIGCSITFAKGVLMERHGVPLCK